MGMKPRIDVRKYRGMYRQLVLCAPLDPRQQLQYEALTALLKYISPGTVRKWKIKK